MIVLSGLLVGFLLRGQDGASPRVERDLVYRTLAPQEAVAGATPLELRLDACLPPGAGPHPALLLVHGGAWMFGDKGDMAPFAEDLVRGGYACFSVDYRLAPAHRFPAQIDDCQYAVQWLRANAARFQIDPARIGALGPSAGGHLVALLGVLDDRADEHAADPVLRQSSRVRCVVDYFGPALITRVQELDFDTLAPPELFGDAPDETYRSASPVTHVTKDDAPFLLIHGDADHDVPVAHSLLLDEALRAAGVESELLVVAGGGHGDFLLRAGGEHWQRTVAFLARHLQQAQPVPAAARER